MLTPIKKKYVFSIVLPQAFDCGKDVTRTKKAYQKILEKIKRPPGIADPEQLTALQHTAKILFDSLPKGTREELKGMGYGPYFS